MPKAILKVKPRPGYTFTGLDMTLVREKLELTQEQMASALGFKNRQTYTALEKTDVVHFLTFERRAALARIGVEIVVE